MLLPSVRRLSDTITRAIVLNSFGLRVKSTFQSLAVEPLAGASDVGNVNRGSSASMSSSSSEPVDQMNTPMP